MKTRTQVLLFAFLAPCLLACRATGSELFLGNPTCPKSGNPIVAEAFFEHEGQRAYFCNMGCAEEGGRDPERWLAIVYPQWIEVGNVHCPVTGRELDPGQGTEVRFQGRRIRVADPAAAAEFWGAPRHHARRALASR